MAWTVKRIEAENFMGYRRLDLDLTKYKGITLIEGQRSGPGTSNGASKSSILEAIHWCLKGRLMRKQPKADKVMHRWMKPDEKTIVRLTIDVDGREFMPERSRSPRGGATLRAHLAGSSSTIDGVQGLIDRVLGLHDDRSLTTTNIFSGAMAQFCQLTDGERKAALERMTGADHYSAAAVRARVLEAEAEAKVQRLGAEVEARTRSIEDACAERQREVTRCIGASQAAQQTERDLMRAAIRASAAADAAHDALRAHYATTLAAQREYDTQADANAAAQAANDTRREELRVSVARAEQSVSAAQAQLATLRRERADMEAGTHPDDCPHCGQRWPQAGLSRPELAKVLKAKDDRILALNNDMAPHKAVMATCNQELEVLRRTKNRLVAELENLKSSVDDRATRRLLTTAIQTEAALATEQAALAAHRAAMPEREGGGLVVECEEIDARIDELRALRQQATEGVEDARALAARFAFWKRGFGKQGLPSFLLDSSIPAMNETVGRLASTLSNGELAVSFDPTAAKGNGDVFAVQVDYADGGDDYDMSSSGEHTRVDLAVMFTLRDLVERRGVQRCTQLFLDECFAGTDPAFADAVMAMLRTHYSDRDVFLISHDDAIKSLCDNVITVRKVGRTAEIV